MLQESTPPYSTTEDPTSLDDYLPLRGSELASTLRKALNIVESQSTCRRTLREPKYDTKALKLLQHLTQNPDYPQRAPDESSESEQGSPVKKPKEEESFCLPSTSFGRGRTTSLDTMNKIVKLADEGKSEKNIQARYKWYRRQYLVDFRRHVEQGGSHSMKRAIINKETLDRFKELEHKSMPIKSYMLRAFARRVALRENAPWFRASKSWLDEFKVKNKISQRKVTKRYSRPRIDIRHK